MTHMTIRDPFPPTNEAAIRQFEVQLNVDLPSTYRSFLLDYNGGRPLRAEFPITGDPLNPSGTINWFFGIHDGQHYDVRRAYSVYQNRVPANFLPIAEDPGGNLICLSIAGNDYGVVYFWDHDYEALSDEVPGYENVYLITNSFAELLESLK
jgi:cell wall assembly regulator SMI1